MLVRLPSHLTTVHGEPLNEPGCPRVSGPCVSQPLFPQLTDLGCPHLSDGVNRLTVKGFMTLFR